MATDSHMERRLGAIEQLNWIIEQTTATNVTAFGTLSGPLLPRLPAALQALQHRHPLLQTHIVYTPPGPPSFRAGAPAIPLRVSDIDPAGIVREIEYELNTAFPAQGPLARCVVLQHQDQEATLLLTIQHTIGDGMAIISLMRDLLQAVAQGGAGQIALEPLGLRPPVEDFLPPAGRGLRGGFNILKMLARQSRMDTTGVLQDQAADYDDVQMAVSPYYLEPAFTRALAQQARNHGTTIHGVLSAALFLAIEEDFADHSKGAHPQNVPLSSVVPVDLHNRIQPTIGEELLLFNAPVTVYYRGGTARSVWEVAAEITAKLNRSIARNEHFAGIGLMKIVCSMLAKRLAQPNGKQRMYEVIKKTEVPTFLFSNLGALKISSTYGPITLKSLGLAGGLSFTMDFGCYIATINDHLCWTFAWKEPRLAQDHVQRLASRAIELVRQAINQG